MKGLSCILFVLFASFIVVPIAYSFNIPADSDKIYEEPQDKGVDDKSSSTSQSSSGDYRGRSLIIGQQGEGISAPIQLIKEISPDGNQSCLINTTMKVKVEVLLTGKNLKTVQILESIDPSLEVSNISKIYIANNLLELPKVERGFEDPERIDEYTEGISAFEIKYNKKIYNNITKEFENDALKVNKYKIDDVEEYSSLNTNNNTFFIEKRNDIDTHKRINENIGKKGRIIYWYNIKPKESGTYSTRTIVRTNDEYQDIDQITKIDVKEPNPDFQVEISGIKNELSCNEELNISYNVIYLGGSTDPVTCDVSISDSIKEYEIVNKKSSYKNESFHLNEARQFYFVIKYPEEGKFYFPELTISSERIDEKINRYAFTGEVIEVIGRIKRNTDLITWIILGFGIIIAQIFSRDLNKATKSILRKLNRFR